jgi:serine/threonine protein kinase
VSKDPARTLDTEPSPTPEPTTGVLKTPQPQPAPSRVSPIAASILPPEKSDPMSSTAPLSPQPLPPPRTSSGSLPGSQQDPSLPKVCSTCQGRYPLDFLVCPRDATPLAVEGADGVDPLVGKVLGEAYQITRLVGEGGMGRVYEAKHLRLKQRRFAVKVLHPELARDPEIVARFQREAESASSIGHPNVVDVYDVHKTHDGVPYMVGEFLEGQEFGGRIDEKGRIDVPTAVHITRQVCRALSAAHKRGIVHRDMKPENVFLVDFDGEISVKVIDFGISKVGQTGKTNLTKTGMIMGTPSYMSPEQARGDKVDRRTDVYAVGAMLYHALTGKKPFDTDDPASTLSLVLTEEPERPRKVNADIPEGLELVVQKAMAKEPADRYATMEELYDALVGFDGVEDVVSSAADATQSKQPTITTKADPNARTMMASGASFSDAKMSRPTIVLTGLGLVLWLVAGMIDAATGALRYIKHDADITSVESTLLAILTPLVAITPAIYFFLHVRKNKWNNSVRALELAGDLRRTFFAAAVSYGLTMLGVRLVMSAALRQSATLSSGSWDVLAFVSSFVVASLTWTSASFARSVRKRRAK